MRHPCVFLSLALIACHASHRDDPAGIETSALTSMRPSTSQAPSRAELLRDGGLYPIPVPLDWKLIGEHGEDVAIPAVPGDPIHRILARGALLATEIHPGTPPELMALRQSPFPGAPSSTILEQYVKQVLDGLTQQGVQPRLVSQQIVPCALSPQPCAKVVVERTTPADDRTERHYLIRDRAGFTWELVYLFRRNSVRSWAPLFAEIDGTPLAQP